MRKYLIFILLLFFINGLTFSEEESYRHKFGPYSFRVENSFDRTTNRSYPGTEHIHYQGERYTVEISNGNKLEIWNCDHLGRSSTKNTSLTNKYQSKNDSNLVDCVYAFVHESDKYAIKAGVSTRYRTIISLLDRDIGASSGSRIWSRKVIADAEPGGVLLGFAAKGLENMGGISHFQICDNGVLLIGEKKNTSINVSVNLEWIKAAIHALYYHKQVYVNEPGVTIDPPSNFQSSFERLSNNKNTDWSDISYINSVFSNQNVRFFGGIENTEYGYILFEADRLLKCLAAGRDNIDKTKTYTSQNVDVYGFKNVLERSAADKSQTSGVSTRFWFTPEYELFKDGNSYYLKGRVKVNTEHTLFGNAAYNAEAEEFTQFFNRNYDSFAKAFPVFKQLEDIAKITCLIQTLKGKGANSSIYKDISIATRQTPQVTPTICNSKIITETKKVNNYIQTQTATYIMAGGVDFHKKPTLVNHLPQDEKTIIANVLWQGFENDYKNYSWEHTNNGKTYVATYIPLSITYPVKNHVEPVVTKEVLQPKLELNPKVLETPFRGRQFLLNLIPEPEKAVPRPRLERIEPPPQLKKWKPIQTLELLPQVNKLSIVISDTSFVVSTPPGNQLPKLLKVLKKGDAVEILDESLPKWIKIKTGEIVGYVNKNDLSLKH
ncbi:MAG: hypothetical protein LBM77_12450 [Spirochaetaceae bacterium]|jgi:hypothetical protein|nr:hypothetical protein [Spirochaetaceae bacterium]